MLKAIVRREILEYLKSSKFFNYTCFLPFFAARKKRKNIFNLTDFLFDRHYYYSNITFIAGM